MGSAGILLQKGGVLDLDGPPSLLSTSLSGAEPARAELPGMDSSPILLVFPETESFFKCNSMALSVLLMGKTVLQKKDYSGLFVSL